MFEEMVNYATQQGWEGLMLRKNVGYCGKRNKDLLKVKKFYDAEYKDITPNDGSPWKKDTNPKD